MNMLEVSARLRAGEAIPVKEQMKLVVSLSVPAILEQLVMTLMSYIDTAMVGAWVIRLQQPSVLWLAVSGS